MNNDVTNILNFDPNNIVDTTTTDNTVNTTLTNTLGSVNSVSSSGFWSYYPYTSGSTSSPIIKKAKNGFVIEYQYDIYIAKNMKDVTKVLNIIFNPITKGKK